MKIAGNRSQITSERQPGRIVKARHHVDHPAPKIRKTHSACLS
jgi:hypothetical protein